MAVSAERIRRHIVEWEARLRPTFYSHRRHWPSRLFRHEPLENILKILETGELLSRADAVARGLIVNDIAPEEIIGANDQAHSHARLYFRPKTPTQYHIEGIREEQDFYQNKHAAVLYMMVFDAVGVLGTEGIQFSEGNMQGHPQVYQDDAGFEQLDFSHIYHEGSIPQELRETIRRARCAEVLCPSPLPLRPNLQAIICRSAAERQLLIHELGPDFDGRERIRVFNEAGVFNADFVFVESVDLASDGIYVQFHPARRGAVTGRVEVRLEALDRAAPPVVWRNENIEFWRKWHFRNAIPDGTYQIEITVRGCLAYRANSILQSDPF